MATEAERLYITLEARLDKYTRDLSQAQAVTNGRLSQIEGRYAKFAANLKASTSSAASGVGGALGGLAVALGGHAVLEYATEWTRLTRSLEGSEAAFGIALKSGHEITQLANEARVDVEAYAKTYVRAAAAVRDFGYTSNDAAAVTSTLAKALKLGQASASEQSSTILQFSQALQKGKLDGDEFRTVMENAGIVQEILAQKLRVSKGEIIEMAQAGKLNIKTLVGAMLEAQGKIDALFRAMPVTVDEAFSVLRNNVVEYLGNADKANGATQALSSGIVGLANNLDTIAIAAGQTVGTVNVAAPGEDVYLDAGTVSTTITNVAGGGAEGRGGEGRRVPHAPHQRAGLHGHVLEDLVERVADVDAAVGIGRAVVKNELRPVFAELTQLLIQANAVPLLQDLRFALRQTSLHRKRRFRQVQGRLRARRFAHHHAAPHHQPARRAQPDRR